MDINTPNEGLPYQASITVKMVKLFKVFLL